MNSLLQRFQSIPQWLVYAMSIYMYDLITINTRMITVYNNKITHYLDREVLEDDEDDLELLYTQIWSGWGDRIDYYDLECIQSNLSRNELDLLGNGVIFRRMENEQGIAI